jgi:CDP-diacylglycerol--glycerol-3-phosphate 3-phosphatidyltransferase
VLVAHSGASRLQFACCLTAAFLSDIFDGVLARRLRVATPGLRRLDSTADTLFYLAALYSAWYLYPEAIRSRAAPLIALAVLEVTRYAFDWLKYRREASYHTWSAKAWGIALFVAFLSLLAYGSDNATLTFAIYLGIAVDLEGLAISAVLPQWQSDVPTVFHVLAPRLTALKTRLRGI